jgi:surface antigen
VRTGIAAALGLFCTGAVSGENGAGAAQAQSAQTCRDSSNANIVAQGDTSQGNTARSDKGAGTLASPNRVANPDSLQSRQTICIPDGRMTFLSKAASASTNASQAPASAQRARAAAVGTVNVFPYGACTWYANQRYHDLYGVFVPWRYNANAWQWTERAYEYGWRVSRSPTVGSIIDLQGGVQGASSLGHVGVVEQVLDSNTVVASSMNWGVNPWSVTRWRFRVGAGVTFISR